MQHQLGAALPAGDLAILVIARIDAEAAGAHFHQLGLGLGLGRGQCGIEHLLQLGLHGGGVAPLARRGQRHDQQILGHLHRACTGQLQHIGGFGQRLRGDHAGTGTQRSGQDPTGQILHACSSKLSRQSIAANPGPAWRRRGRQGVSLDDTIRYGRQNL
ncbi:hypothetical protein D3C71_1479620 [compost metagenome]